MQRPIPDVSAGLYYDLISYSCSLQHMEGAFPGYPSHSLLLPLAATRAQNVPSSLSSQRRCQFK